MARHVPAEFAEKVRQVQAEVERARTERRRAFEVGPEVLPGVRLVSSQAHGVPVVFSLWTWDRDVAELCGDAAYPATAGLLAIDRAQIGELGGSGVAVDLSYLTRSESVPGVYYALLDHLSPQQLRVVLARLLPGEASPAASAPA
jgi:hypothetical protein